MFIKFPDIENHYRQEFIEKYVNKYPNLMNCDYTIESKIDGSNISIICLKNGDVRFASRKQLVGDCFSKLDEAKEKYKTEIEILKNYAISQKKDFQWYGELFGKKVINRIDYGPFVYIRLFNVMIDGEFQSSKVFYNLLSELNLERIKVPVLGIAHGLKEALDWNEVFVNVINPSSNDEEEGIVIKPLNNVYSIPGNGLFAIKKKNPKFIEKCSRQHHLKKSKYDDIPSEIFDIRELFLSYITESRAYSVFSKDGHVISSQEEIGDYIKKITEDAKKDFNKENPQYENLDKKYKKIIFNCGPNISKILINIMKENIRKNILDD